MKDVQTRVFFDRGVIDSVTPQAPRWMWAAARRLRYNKLVFVPPPWREIYAQDAERRQTFEDCLAVHDAIQALLQRLDYRPVELPCATASERADFVLAAVDKA